MVNVKIYFWLLGYLRTTKTLIENGANVDATNSLGESVLAIADENGNSEWLNFK